MPGCDRRVRGRRRALLAENPPLLPAVKFYFRCPYCGSDEEFAKPPGDTSLGCAVSLLGFFPALPLAHHFRRRVQCRKCGHIFPQPPLPRGSVAKFAGWIMAIIIIPLLV